MKWQFSKIPNIEESNFNKVLERFYSLGVAGLTRENIQNSLDGRLPNSEEPVVVTIQLGTMKRAHIPGVEEIVTRINSLEGRNSYTKETIAHMKASMLDEEVRYISFEDAHTKGLTGAKYGQSNNPEHTWGIYAYNKGVHFEEKDEAFEASRGGSHGVGKIASNAASDLHLMFFANCDANGEQHLGGTIQLIEHYYNDAYYRSTGYFAKLEQTKFMPYENTYGHVFEKNTRGLKIVIPFLRESFYDEAEVIRAVCDSFFVAILQRKLIVHVNDLTIDATSIEHIVKQEQYYEQRVPMMKKVFTPLYVNTFMTKEPRTITIPHRDTVFTFQLYFQYDEQIAKGRVGIVRTIGMKIEDFAAKNNATKPYNAVLIGGTEEDTYLKSLENESHTKISSEGLKDPQLKREANKFIRLLTKEIVQVIEEEIRRRNPVDGQMNTADVLYTTEIAFKENLAQSFGKVKIQNGLNVVTSHNGEANDTAPGKEKRKPRHKKERPTNGSTTGVRRKSKAKNDGDGKAEEQEPLDQYQINAYRVERLVLSNEEYIRINLQGNEEIGNKKSCNIKLNVIDGMGKECVGEFDLLQNYAKAEDASTEKPCEITRDVIKGVPIERGIVSLRLSLLPSYNRTLKFVYYVEV